jgi:hypothetical protein
MRTRLLVLIAACLAIAVPASSIAPALAGGHDLSAAKAKKKKKKKKKKGKGSKAVDPFGTFTGTLGPGGTIQIVTSRNGYVTVTVKELPVTCTHGDGSTSPKTASFYVAASGKPASGGALSPSSGTNGAGESITISGSFGKKPATGKLTYSQPGIGGACGVTDASWSATKK